MIFYFCTLSTFPLKRGNLWLAQAHTKKASYHKKNTLTCLLRKKDRCYIWAGRDYANYTCPYFKFGENIVVSHSLYSFSQHTHKTHTQWVAIRSRFVASNITSTAHVLCFRLQTGWVAIRCFTSTTHVLCFRVPCTRQSNSFTGPPDGIPARAAVLARSGAFFTSHPNAVSACDSDGENEGRMTCFTVFQVAWPLTDSDSEFFHGPGSDSKLATWFGLH